MPNCIGNAFQVYFTIFLIKAQHTGGAFCGYIRTCAAHAVRYGFYAGVSFGTKQRIFIFSFPRQRQNCHFPHVLILYMLPYGLFPERQRNENLELPVLNIRNELPAVFAADSLHVAHSVAMVPDSAPRTLYKCHFNSLLRLAAVAHGNFKRTLRL